MSPVIDRDQIKKDFEEFRILILGIVGGLLGFILAGAAILHDHVIFDILYGGTVLAGVLLFLNNLYDRYTVSGIKKNTREGETGE